MRKFNKSRQEWRKFVTKQDQYAHYYLCGHSFWILGQYTKCLTILLLSPTRKINILKQSKSSNRFYLIYRNIMKATWVCKLFICSKGIFQIVKEMLYSTALLTGDLYHRACMSPSYIDDGRQSKTQELLHLAVLQLQLRRLCLQYSAGEPNIKKS